MKRLHVAIGLCALAGMTAGCNKGAGSAYKPQPATEVAKTEIIAGQEDSLFPAEVGHTWVYDVTNVTTGPSGSDSNQAEATFRVTAVKIKPEGKVIAIDVFTNGKKVEQLIWRLSDKGLFEVSDTRQVKKGAPMLTVNSVPPAALIPFPPKEGTDIQHSLTSLRPDGTVGPMSFRCRVDGMQDVDTEMGRLHGVAVAHESKFRKNNVAFTWTKRTWFVPKVGIARMMLNLVIVSDTGRRASQSSTLRLKSHSP